MEIFKSNKKKEWKHKLRKLSESETIEMNRLKSIDDSLDEDNEPFEDDETYLEKKYQQIKELGINNYEKVSNEYPKTSNISQKLELIKKLNQKEIGNFSRLESIRNYLNDGQTLLSEDEIYLNEQYENLKKVLGNNERFDIESKS